MRESFTHAAAPDPVLTQLVQQVETLAREAGAILMNYYGKSYAVEIKDDSSPVTIADEESSNFLVRELERLTPSYPVVSEENDIDPTRDGVTKFWAVDPLDGTKEFIDKTGGFCVKIALIEEARPTLGVVYCPAHDILYATIENAPATKTNRRGIVQVLETAPAADRPRLRVLFNQKHADPTEYLRYRAIMADHGVKISARPAIKPGLPRSLRVAEGLSDLHVGSGFAIGPMAGSGFIWDNAADHLILINAGGGMVNLTDGQDPSYGKARGRMPAFLAYGDPVLRAKLFP